MCRNGCNNSCNKNSIIVEASTTASGVPTTQATLRLGSKLRFWSQTLAITVSEGSTLVNIENLASTTAFLAAVKLNDQDITTTESPILYETANNNAYFATSTGITYSSGNGRATLPYNGIYNVQVNTSVYNGFDGHSFIRIKLIRNNAISTLRSIPFSPFVQYQTSVDASFSLLANDILYVTCQTNSLTDTTKIAGLNREPSGEIKNWFNITLVNRLV